MYKNAFFCNNNNIVLGIFLSLEDKKNSLYVSVQYFFYDFTSYHPPPRKGGITAQYTFTPEKNTKTFSKIEIISVLSAILRNLQLCIVWPISICDFWNNSPVALFSPTSQKILEPESYGSISLYSNKSKRELLNNGAHCWSILF